MRKINAASQRPQWTWASSQTHLGARWILRILSSIRRRDGPLSSRPGPASWVAFHLQLQRQREEKANRQGLSSRLVFRGKRERWRERGRDRYIYSKNHLWFIHCGIQDKLLIQSNLLNRPTTGEGKKIWYRMSVRNSSFAGGHP